MINAFRGYVRTKDKQPVQKFKYEAGVKLLTLAEAEKLDEYAGVLNGEYTVMDIDDAAEAGKVIRLINALNLNCRMYKTTRGVHVMFKKSRYAPKGGAGLINSLGIHLDIRTGRNMYIILKFAGKKREILRDFDEDRPIDTFPKLFGPIKSTQIFSRMGEGDGRNDALFKHIVTLMRCGFTPDEAEKSIRLINEYILEEPLTTEELDKVCRKEAFDNLIQDVEFEAVDSGFKPKELTDIGMAELFAKVYENEIRYSDATGWIVWTGKQWEIDDLKAEKKYIQFLKRCCEFAKKSVANAYVNASKETDESEEPKKFKKTAEIERAEALQRFMDKMCDSSKVSGVRKLARSFVQIDIKELDKNQFDLNTPAGIVDLKTGSIRSHDPKAMCTKITSFAPGDGDLGKWLELLDLVTLKDESYVHYLKVLSGAFLVGAVYHEALVIAYGDGANGKSTVFNTMLKILGDYSGKIPSESLTTRVKNAKVDLAELLGKRFVLASETDEGARLSNTMLKQIASTDEITAEKKYHDPFRFEPTHSALLYTNFLPQVGSIDDGTWRRLIICPFNAKISKPKKDFAEKLLESSAPAILSWMIEGAKEFIEAEYNLPACAVVEEARAKYREQNDWLESFLNDCCLLGDLEKCAGGKLYKAYRQWCQDTGEYCRRNRDFTDALRKSGFDSKKVKGISTWEGLTLSPDRSVGRLMDDDFLR